MERLNSWKEIASYLGVTVRTAQKWEHERGLPVERLPGTRGPVSISVSELEAWRQSAAANGPNGPSQNGTGTPHSQESDLPRRRMGLIAAGLLTVLLLSAGAWSVRSQWIKRSPATFTIAGKVLVVRDSAGEIVWQHVFAGPLAVGTYEARQMGWFEDLDGDGQNELLFIYLEANPKVEAKSVLYCFSHDGKVRWRFDPGGPVRTAFEAFDPVFSVRNLVVTRHSKLGTVIVTTNPHHTYYPNQVAVLSPGGEVLAEYWHSGHLNQMKAEDSDGDGKQEIYLGGVNNDLTAATLVVLDLEAIVGKTASRQNPKYQLLDMPLGAERWRLIFPRSCINRALFTFNAVAEIRFGMKNLTISTQEEFRLTGAPTVMYEFDRKLQLRAAEPTGEFPMLHARLERLRYLDHSLSAAELQAFRSVQYLARPSHHEPLQ